MQRALLAAALAALPVDAFVATGGARWQSVRPVLAIHRPTCPPRALPPAAADTSSDKSPQPVAEAPAVASLRARLGGWATVSLWTQGGLALVGAVLLVFANSAAGKLSVAHCPLHLRQCAWHVRRRAHHRPRVWQVPVLVGRALSLASLGAAAASWLWTWRYVRLSRSLARAPLSPSDAGAKALGALGAGVFVNIAGLGLGMLGAEAIVGTLAAKALTQGTALIVGAAAAPIQPLDILVVQANTNALAAHFISLCVGMRLQSAARNCATAA